MAISTRVHIPNARKSCFSLLGCATESSCQFCGVGVWWNGGAEFELGLVESEQSK